MSPPQATSLQAQPQLGCEQVECFLQHSGPPPPHSAALSRSPSAVSLLARQSGLVSVASGLPPSWQVDSTSDVVKATVVLGSPEELAVPKKFQ